MLLDLQLAESSAKWVKMISFTLSLIILGNSLQPNATIPFAKKSYWQSYVSLSNEGIFWWMLHSPIRSSRITKNLEVMIDAAASTPGQFRWCSFLRQFNVHLFYRPGLQQGKPDALSRRIDYQTGTNYPS